MRRSSRRVRVPAWVPKPVADYARRTDDFLTERSNYPRSTFRKFLVALVSDERMRGVWRELSRHHRDGSYIHPARARRDAGEAADERQGEAMVALLDRAVICAAAPGATTTKARVILRCEALLAKADALFRDAQAGGHQEMVRFAGARGIWTKDRRETLMAAAQVYHEVALATAEAGMKMALERDAGDHFERWIARALADKCRELFGSPMYGVVATIMTVIRTRNVSARMVRQWVGPTMRLRRVKGVA